MSANISTFHASVCPPRKKLKRIVHSCLECRRRKVRCEPDRDGQGNCSACTSRGIVCEKQEDPGDGDLQLDARLRRVERVLHGMTSLDDRNDSASPAAAHPKRDSISALKDGQDQPPLISLFDNEVFGRQDRHGTPDPPLPAEVLSESKTQRARLSLMLLLPTQHDVDLIGASTNAWGLRQVVHAAINDSPNQAQTQSAFDIRAISKSSSVVIARTLLYLAICMQQLPPGFDTTALESALPIDTIVYTYMTSVTELVTSNEDLACSMEGLECLLLQSLFYINEGNLRRAWLSGRRSIYIAQFLGLQKSFIHYDPEKNDESEWSKRMMWQKVVTVDRYLAVILGFPCGVGPDCFGLEDRPEQDARATKCELLGRKLCIIAGYIIARNQLTIEGSYTSTLEIDEKLEKLAKSMSQGWFDIPILSAGRRSSEDVEAFDLVLNQLWYYQLVQMLHLPWMLRAFSDQRYEYSKSSCLRASREMLHRYLALRSTNNTQLQARVVDFATVIAAVTLILNQVGSALGTKKDLRVLQTAHGDEGLISRVVDSMGIVARYRSEFMARQGLEVIQALLAVRDQSHGANQSGKLRLTIPFIGTIHITRNQNSGIPTQRQQSARTNDTVYGSLQPPHEPELELDRISDDLYQSSAPQLSFDQINLPSPSWFPSLESWDPENFGPFIFEDIVGLHDTAV